MKNNLEKIVIGIDANGGDFDENKHPSFEILKALQYLEKNYLNDFLDVKFKLYGFINKMYESILFFHLNHFNLELHNSDGYFIDLRTIKDYYGNKLKKTDSSLFNILNDLKNDKIDCAFSCGETASLIAYSKKELGMIQNLSLKYPPLLSEIPKSNGESFIFADSGAVVDYSSKEMLELAILCNIYAISSLNLNKPKIGLLSNGIENNKGNLFLKETDRLIKEYIQENNNFNYVGFVEGKKGIFENDVRIVLADGFTGNTNLKTMEGAVECVKNRLKNDLFKMKNGSFLDKFSLLSCYLAYKIISKTNTYKQFINDFNPSTHNGAPLLGLKKYVVKGHGSSDYLGIANGLRKTIQYYKSDTINILKEKIIKE
jgi:phosphate acyltransferase